MPANSYQWIDAVMTRLFEPEMRRIDKAIATLADRQYELTGKPVLGFMHLGEVFMAEAVKPLYRTVKANEKSKMTPPLCFQLMGEVSAFMSDHNKLKLDQAMIRQVLFKLLHQANTKQEIRDALPECVVSIMPDFRDMPRYIQDPTWLIRSDYRAVRDYERILPKIEFYAMTRLIY